MFVLAERAACFYFLNIQEARGQQCEFGESQRDRGKASSPSPSEEDNVILSSLKNRGILSELLKGDRGTSYLTDLMVKDHSPQRICR